MSAGECPSCGLMFASQSSFDRHLVGSIADEDRRCLTPEEMRSGLPMRSVKKSHGGWIEPRPTPWSVNKRGHWTHRPTNRAFPGSPIAALSDAGAQDGSGAVSGRPGAERANWHVRLAPEVAAITRRDLERSPFVRIKRTGAVHVAAQLVGDVDRTPRWRAACADPGCWQTPTALPLRALAVRRLLEHALGVHLEVAA